MISVGVLILLGLFLTVSGRNRSGELYCYSCNYDKPRTCILCIHIAPDSGLYFTLNGILYLPGKSVFFADIGKLSLQVILAHL